MIIVKIDNCFPVRNKLWYTRKFIINYQLRVNLELICFLFMPIIFGISLAIPGLDAPISSTFLFSMSFAEFIDKNLMLL